jgi:nucleotide-binding universal stress UspA family protein
MSNTDSNNGRRIVAGVDGSTSSISALRWAIRQARLTGTRVDAVIAWRYWPMFAQPEMMDVASVVAAYEDDARDILAQAVADSSARDSEVEVRQRVIEGHPAQVLLDAADGADLLVVGSRGHGGFTEALLGSVGQHCVQHAPCPVVIIRGKGQEQPDGDDAGR